MLYNNAKPDYLYSLNVNLGLQSLKSSIMFFIDLIRIVIFFSQVIAKKLIFTEFWFVLSSLRQQKLP